MHDDGLACGKYARAFSRYLSPSLRPCLSFPYLAVASRVHSGASRASASRILEYTKVRESIFRFASVNPDGANLWDLSVLLDARYARSIPEKMGRHKQLA